jgi:hypothetical protein
MVYQIQDNQFVDVCELLNQHGFGYWFITSLDGQIRYGPKISQGWVNGVEPNIEDLERVTQTLVNPPNLPAHDQSAKGGPKVVQMTMVIEEKEIEVNPGVFVQAMTFNGTNPGPMIVVHQDDYVELT